MEAVKEVTVWADAKSAVNHTYLLDGDKMVAYIRYGTTEPFWFKNPIKGFSRSGRKFETLKTNPFKESKKEEVLMPWIKKVQGSKPNTFYTVNTDENTCTCPGFTFRGSCKHVKELETC
jgi:hypothetical protein